MLVRAAPSTRHLQAEVKKWAQGRVFALGEVHFGEVHSGEVHSGAGEGEAGEEEGLRALEDGLVSTAPV